MSDARAFVGMGSNVKDARAHLTDALVALDQGGTHVVACARPRWTPFIGGSGQDVLNTVVELRGAANPRALLQRLLAIESEAGRDRSDQDVRALDLDLLAFGDERVEEPDLTVPHPRALDRGFVLAPWAEIAPLFSVRGPRGRTHEVIRWRATLQHRAPEAFDVHWIENVLPFRDRGGTPVVLEDRAALDTWRAGCEGPVGVLPTMGALHSGHASLAQRAVAECEHVVATIFVNPLQFAKGEDIDRYPRTFDDDLAQLGRAGVHAVYAPAPDDLYAEDFSMHVVPRDMADRYEGAERPTHFEGVTTVVTKLLNRTRPDRAYFAWKDAQQLAIVRRLVRDLDLPGVIVPCPTVYAANGLALSSRNRYLDDKQRDQALGLSRALARIRERAAAGGTEIAALCAEGRQVLEAQGVHCDYLAVVAPDTFDAPETLGEAPLLAIGAVRLGETRLIDNRWIARPV